MTALSEEEYNALLASLSEPDPICRKNEFVISEGFPYRTTFLKPYVEITEQPEIFSSLISRDDVYDDDDLWHHICGESYTAKRKSYPTIKVCNYEGPLAVLVSCVTADYQPHPNNLVGQGCLKGVCAVKFKQGDLLHFPRISIRGTSQDGKVSSLQLRKDMRVDPFKTGFDYDINPLDLRKVRLCFQVFLPDETGMFRRIVHPVATNVIYDIRLLLYPHEDLDHRLSIPIPDTRVTENVHQAVPQSPTNETNNVRITGVAGGSVSNSNACAIQIVGRDLNMNTHVKEEVAGVSCRVVQGDESSVLYVKLSVPAKDGDSKVLVTCQDGEVKKCLYLHDDGTPEKSHTKWTFRNVVHGLMEVILGESAESFSQFEDVLKSVYGCKLSKAYNHCLVLEFLHDNDEEAERMMEDRDNVKKLFMKFLKDIGKEGTDEVEVSCEKMDVRRTRRSDDGSVPSTSQEEDILLSTPQRSHGIKKEAFSSMMHSSEWKRRVKRELHLVTEDAYEGDPPFKKRKSIEEEEEKCDKCEAVLQQYRKLGKGGIYILHLPSFVIHDPELINIQTQEKTDGCLKILSALRNAEGGTLLLHLDSQRDSKLMNDRIMSFIHTMCKKVIAPGEVSCDVFEVERDSHNDGVYILQTERSDSIITINFKTKMPGPTKYWDETSTDELRPFLSGKRKIADKKPELFGLAQSSQAINIVKLEYEQPGTPQTEYELADIMVNDLFLAEHITAYAKRRQGGSVFIGQPFHVKIESPVHGLDIKGFDFETGFEEKFRLSLQQTLEAHILVYNNIHSVNKLQAKDVFEIGLHKLNEGFIVEVAVRAVNGCVFYDPKGPEAYKIEKGVIQSIPFDIWIEGFVHS